MADAEEPVAAEPAVETGRGIARRDALTVYVQQARRFPLLSHARQHELAVAYFDGGDPAMARELVTANLRLVMKIAHEYRRNHNNLLDLIQEGNLGLLRAVEKFDPHRGVKFTSYAAWWIRAYMLRFILNNLRLVKVGTTHAQRKLFFNLNREKEKLERMGITPEHAVLAERLDVRTDEVIEMERRLGSADLSLDAPLSRDEDDGRTRLDMTATDDLRPDERVERAEYDRLLHDILSEFAAGLGGRDRALFESRWLSEEPATLQQVGDRFGISRERTRQIEKRLLRRLRAVLEARLGGDVQVSALHPE